MKAGTWNMTAPTFSWDPKKNAENIRRHGVDFEAAKSVFYDEHAKLINDPDHSSHEHRFILLGMSSRFRMLLIVHSYRRDEDEIRIISARKANKHETKEYQGD
jgi:uncharacterized DUF497 family protein